MSAVMTKKEEDGRDRERASHITKIVRERKDFEHLEYERCRGDQVTRISVVGENGKALAHLWPDKRFSAKKVKAISIMYYDKHGHRCTRFLSSPKNKKDCAHVFIWKNICQKCGECA